MDGVAHRAYSRERDQLTPSGRGYELGSRDCRHRASESPLFGETRPPPQDKGLPELVFLGLPSMAFAGSGVNFGCFLRSEFLGAILDQLDEGSRVPVCVRWDVLLFLY